MDCCTTA
ncbi:hypothetical protein E2C01_083260 [Portunus trituberculatus]|nr:hypothetical protein [Portunus trituberculatus]